MNLRRFHPQNQQFFRTGRRRRNQLVRLSSGAALATVVCVLIEVPVMLSIVKIVNNTRGWYANGAAVKRRSGIERKLASPTSES
jgi:ACR3 family arsenite transporter